MPKELSHIFFAKSVYKGLNEGSELKRMIGQNQNLYLFGSFVPDTFAYLFYGKNRRGLNQKFINFHNTTNNSYLPIVNLLKVIDKNLYDISLAFIAGVVSHMVADRVFHPLVYYFSKRNISRHYLMESYLDIYFCQGIFKRNRIYLKKILDRVELKEEQFNDLIAGLFGLSQIDYEAIKRAVNCHMKIQKLFYVPLIRIILTLLNIIPGINLKPMISLCYPRVSNSAIIFKGVYKYQNPITGDLVSTTIDQLRDLILQKTKSIFSQMEKRIKNKERMIDYFNNMQGENLNTNIYGKGKEDERFWDTGLKIKQLVYRP